MSIKEYLEVVEYVDNVHLLTEEVYNKFYAGGN